MQRGDCEKAIREARFAKSHPVGSDLFVLCESIVLLLPLSFLHAPKAIASEVDRLHPDRNMALKLLGQQSLLSDAPRIFVAGLVLYAVGLVAYRLLFHPLRNIPGPWYAAATYWYEFYQDVILDGHYIKDYPKLHAKYGE